MQVNMLQAMQQIAGGDATIEDTITKAQSSDVIMMHQLGRRTSAFLVALDDGRTILLDTGSLHTIMTRKEWQRLFDEGTASGLVPRRMASRSSALVMTLATHTGHWLTSRW